MEWIWGYEYLYLPSSLHTLLLGRYCDGRDWAKPHRLTVRFGRGPISTDAAFLHAEVSRKSWEYRVLYGLRLATVVMGRKRILLLDEKSKGNPGKNKAPTRNSK